MQTNKVLSIDLIRTDCETQMRVAKSESAISEYAEALGRGCVFPAVTVFSDGKEYWLADGFHRYESHKKCGLDSILCEIREGTLNDARKFACEANASHGLPRTNEDKRNAIKNYFKVPGMELLSNSEVAKNLNVSHHLVRSIREAESIPASPCSHIGGGGKGGIGKFQKTDVASKGKMEIHKGQFITLYNVSTVSARQCVSLLRVTFQRSYLEDISKELHRVLSELP